MKNVRVWFEKDNECRFISHLDLNRCMLRALHKSKVPIWHTEGFNPHPFVTFALPLSLGFHGKKETMDMKLLEEDFPFGEIISRLNSCLPAGIKVYQVTEPKMKPGKIKYAAFQMKLTCETIAADSLYETVNKLFAMDTILIDKKSKSGIKEVDLKPNFHTYKITHQQDFVQVDIILPAGSTNNVNPSLILKALKKYYQLEVYGDITRTDVFNEEEQPFE